MGIRLIEYLADPVIIVPLNVAAPSVTAMVSTVRLSKSGSPIWYSSLFMLSPSRLFMSVIL